MNITMDSLTAEIAKFQSIIDKYDTIPEYVNPNYSRVKAAEMIQMLNREIYFNTKR